LRIVVPKKKIGKFGPEVSGWKFENLEMVEKLGAVAKTWNFYFSLPLMHE
jgi:hypothetical protein